MSMCLDCICSSISIDNAIELLKFADVHSIDRLKTKSVDFIVSHAKDIVNDSGFGSIRHLNEKVIAEVFRRLATQGSENGPLKKKLRL